MFAVLLLALAAGLWFTGYTTAALVLVAVPVLLGLAVATIATLGAALAAVITWKETR